MKKVLSLLMVAALLLCMTACNKALSYAEYVEAELKSQVTVECYVQDHQSWWDGKITVYAADENGAYFIYNMACAEEDAAKLVPGTKIKVTGIKDEWAGEVEITEATFKFEDGNYIAAPVDLTKETKDLSRFQNMLAAFKDAIVLPYDETGAGFAYKSTQGDDLYFKALVGGTVIEFCVESYLRGADTEVYKTVESLIAGDVIDVEGFLYWYNGANPHVTKVTITKDAMTKAQYDAAAKNDPVYVLMYVMDNQSYYASKEAIVVYGATQEGGYLAYNLHCAAEDVEKLMPGVAILVEGTKTAYSGEIEIAEGATFTFLPEAGSYMAPATDLTAVFGTEALEGHMNEHFTVKGAEIVAKADGAAFWYNYNATGSHDGNSDLYFDVKIGENVFTFTVESYLRNNTTDVYAAVENLKVGDIVDLEGYLYWYNGANPHIIDVKVAE